MWPREGHLSSLPRYPNVKAAQQDPCDVLVDDCLTDTLSSFATGLICDGVAGEARRRLIIFWRKAKLLI